MLPWHAREHNCAEDAREEGGRREIAAKGKACCRGRCECHTPLTSKRRYEEESKRRVGEAEDSRAEKRDGKPHEAEYG